MLLKCYLYGDVGFGWTPQDLQEHGFHQSCDRHGRVLAQLALQLHKVNYIFDRHNEVTHLTQRPAITILTDTMKSFASHKDLL